MVLEAKIEENRDKKGSENHVIFACVFFHRFWRGLGRVLGRFWEGFGSSLASCGTLLSYCLQGLFAKRAQEGPRGGQEVSWARFGKVLEGFWEGFGRPKW